MDVSLYFPSKRDQVEEKRLESGFSEECLAAHLINFGRQLGRTERLGVALRFNLNSIHSSLTRSQIQLQVVLVIHNDFQAAESALKVFGVHLLISSEFTERPSRFWLQS